MTTTISRLTVLLFVAMTVLCGCTQDQIAAWHGAPTSDDYAELQKQQAEAKEALAEADETIAAFERELAKATKESDLLAAKEETLKGLQAELAAQLAGAAGASRDAIIRAMRQVDAEIVGLTNATASVVATLADFNERLVAVQVARERHERAFEAAKQGLTDLEAQSNEAVSRSGALVRSAGEAAGNLGVPGAAPVANEIAGVIEGLVGLLIGGTAMRQLGKRKQRQLEEEVEEKSTEAAAARKVIAVTESFGIKEIASDPTVAAKAKAAMAADPEVMKQYAMGKAAAAAPVLAA